MPYPNLAGRPKGSNNTLAILQRRIAEFMHYGPGGKTDEAILEFAAQQRKELLSGTMPPLIRLRWLDYLLGKPEEHIEISVNPEEYVGMNPEVLRARIARLAEEAQELQTIDVTPTKPPMEINP